MKTESAITEREVELEDVVPAANAAGKAAMAHFRNHDDLESRWNMTASALLFAYIQSCGHLGGVEMTPELIQSSFHGMSDWLSKHFAANAK
jgi:hypothetical protein